MLYMVDIKECPVCGKQNKISVESEDSERDCVIRVIGRLKNHFRTCESKPKSQIGFYFDLKMRVKGIRYNLVTYETKSVKRKLIV